MLPHLFQWRDAPHHGLGVLATMGTRGAAAAEVITGYDNHQRYVREMASGPKADSRFLIGRIARVFVSSLTSDEPIREVWIRGHSDRVWTPRGHNTADEKSVSEDRARDVRSEFFNAVVTDPIGLFTPLALAEAIRTGTLRVLTAGLGARFPLRSTSSGAVPENRRVEILLWVNQSVPI